MTVRRPEIRFDTVSQASFDDAAARQYPYVFLPAYLNFLEQQSARRVLYAVSSDGEVRLPLLVKSSRVFRLGQILSPPLRSGAQLSPEEERSFLEALIESLRTGSNRLGADLQLLEGNLSDVRGAVEPRPRFEREADVEPERTPAAAPAPPATQYR